MASDRLEINEFTLDSMRRIATEIRRMEAQYQNLARQVNRIKYSEPKLTRNFLLQATETIPARSGSTPGEGGAKVMARFGDVTRTIDEYNPDGAATDFMRYVNNHTSNVFSTGTQFLAIEDAFGKLWAISEGSTNISTSLSPFEIKTGERLDPGGSAIGLLLVWDGLDWQVSAEEHVLHDRFYRNFLVAGERCWAQSTPTIDSGTGTGTGTGNSGWDIIGENGLKRTGVALSQIQSGASGLVIVYSGPVTIFGLPTCTTVSSGLSTIACNTSSAATVQIGDVIFLHFHPDSFEWFIVGKSELRHGYATLDEDLCATDTVNVTNQRLIDGTLISPGPVSISNAYLHRGRSGDRVYISLINFDQVGDLWTIVDVKKQQETVVLDLAYGEDNIGTDDLLGTTPLICATVDQLRVTAAVETCEEPEIIPVFSGRDIEVVTGFEIEEDQQQDLCRIVAKTKTICQLLTIPRDGPDVVVASMTKKKFLKNIYEEQICVGGFVQPVIAGLVQDVYVLCFNEPVEEVQIELQVCPGDEEVCTGTGTV